MYKSTSKEMLPLVPVTTSGKTRYLIVDSLYRDRGGRRGGMGSEAGAAPPPFMSIFKKVGREWGEKELGKE